MRNLHVVAVIGVVVLVLSCGPAGAEFLDGIQVQQPSKWSQWADVTGGRNILSYMQLDPELDEDPPVTRVVADDWRCTNGLPVTDLHWWGSYLAGEPGGVWGFGLFIHADVPATTRIPSHPGEMLWEVGPLYVGEGEGDVSENYYATAPDDHEIYQYNYVIPDPEGWFHQDEDQVYWLVIVAAVNDNVTRWGWHTAGPPFPENGIDAAVILRDYDIIDDGTYSEWGAVFHNEERVQMAFELSTIPEPSTVCLVGTAVLTAAGIVRRRRIR